ncbi:GntR family transcriptional regulator [Limoniibacter endophyticus]|uniref:GntR family transcriptional regulator n=1 Tax=Limoniibacter endophyticus TaxID=1565040 RepID=A0A8J3GGJ6_9HYPH|nr:GntR family transcriptional regulator [Limoniibacter endophyticus]GHC73568.1 GntR family transcriptional regulator [Limoniibacter endophyticus]
MPSSHSPTPGTVAASEIAYVRLQQMIVRLELLPGALMTEGALIERLDMGRTPVREALQRLALEGFAEIRPRSGIAISPLHISDWLQVLDAAFGLKIVLARSAARFPPLENDLFRKAALNMQRATVSGNVVSYLEAESNLDLAIAQASANGFAARAAAPLQAHARRFWYRFRSEQGLASVAEKHLALINAIMSGDVTGAGQRAEECHLTVRRMAEQTASAR